MANQTVTANLQVIQFRNDFFREYVRTNRLSPYTGTDVTNPVVIKEGRGPTIRHPLLTRMTGTGVSGSDTLRGNGENIGNYSWDTTPTYYRNAVEFDKEQMEQTNIDLMRAARPLLMEWAMASTRDRQLRAMSAVYNGTTYANLDNSSFSQAIADTWQTNNTDRILYGADTAHNSGDHSVDLAKVTNSTDDLTAAVLSTWRRLAEDADPHIRPIQTTEAGEVFVAFVGSNAFGDLKTNLTTTLSNSDFRGMKVTGRDGNVLARDDDIFYDGVIVRKVPEITTLFSSDSDNGNLLTAGNASSKLEIGFLCGAQAVVWGLGQRPGIEVDRTFDYGFQPGVAVELKEDLKKAFFNNKQHGMVTGFFPGA